MPSLIALALSVFAFQGLLMLVDESVFHLRRRHEMPRWERLGHPLDTLTVLTPILLARFLPASEPWTIVFLALAVFSCVFVTKDEPVHAVHCTPGEHWLHALLFMVHPLLFAALWILWKQGQVGWISLQVAVTFGFLCWQTVYWNGPWAPQRKMFPLHQKGAPR